MMYKILLSLIFIFVGCQHQIKTDPVDTVVTKNEITKTLESDIVKISPSDSKERAIEKTEIRILLERAQATIEALEKEILNKDEKINDLEKQISKDEKYVRIGKMIQKIIIGIFIAVVLFITGFFILRIVRR